jgi:serine protease inhibitor
MKTLCIVMCLSMAGSLMAQTTEPAAGVIGQGSLGRDNAAFALDLYGKLRGQPGNVFFSPHSISAALAMTYAGARGDTAVQMRKALRFEMQNKDLFAAFGALDKRLDGLQQAGKVRLLVANSLWPQQKYPLRADYLALIEKNFGAAATPLDYVGATEKSRTTINEWVEGKTEKKITNLIPDGVLDAMTRLVLVNAIYFKADWDKKFDKAATRDAAFFVAPEKEVTAPMMNIEADAGYGDFEQVQVLWLPYAGKGLGMTVILPKEKDGLTAVEAALTTGRLQEWTQPIPKLRKVRVALPRFKTTGQFRLDDQLKSLGMADAFDQKKADFSGMDGQKWLYIGAVLHKAFVEVNEEGSEAAAATAVAMQLKSMPARLPVFRADHPFIFMIRDNASGAILFLGRMTNPKDKDAE